MAGYFGAEPFMKLAGAIGKTRVTMVINITANLVNIALNYLLIGGNFGFPRLGVKGAAIASVTGEGVVCGNAFF